MHRRGGCVLGLVLAAWTATVPARTYYVDADQGRDRYHGTSPRSAVRTLARAADLPLEAGDALRLATGRVYEGSLQLRDLRGTAERPIVIGSYRPRAGARDARAVIDGRGWPNALLLTDCAGVRVEDLTLQANGGGLVPGADPQATLRCGVLVTTARPGTYGDVTLTGLRVHDVFFEDPGFRRGPDEVHTANGTQAYGWGIRCINRTSGAVLARVTVRDCVVENVAHTGIKFTTFRGGITDLAVTGNRVTRTGGPGMQMSGVVRGHVWDNAVDHSGSPDDTRKWGRGSGLWTWGSDAILIEHNRFTHAHGPADSAGCHIDFNCNHVVVQYNLSAYNAGGFCEILGNNHNCAYRYNVSINDGNRTKGQGGASQDGKVFWLSGYVGSKQPRRGPFDTYVYNNTVYVGADQVARMAVVDTAAGVFVANNIFCIVGDSQAVSGAQYRLAAGRHLDRVVCTNNLFLRRDNWPTDLLVQDAAPRFGDPAFTNPGGERIEDYRPTAAALVRDRGIVPTALPEDPVGLTVGLTVTADILGRPIVGLPDLGAIEVAGAEGRR